MKYTPGRALAELMAQHDALRGMMDRCEDLATELDAGRMGPTQLTREVARLRLAFDAHNAFEEQLLRPVLLEGDAFASVRIERMVEDHVEEHRAMRVRLGSPITAELRDAIETLRAHLEAEERYLLTAKVLRDDELSIEHAG
ncbi:MAG: hemerythrin domain-containing protein [Myxococcota bacterium]|nr:hemerythrin domain-containing protein [Myxococcota bacterium]